MSRARARTDKPDRGQPECPRCGERFFEITTIGPGDHIVGCGCRVGRYRLREFER